MAIKVIKPGKDLKISEYNTTCIKCGCEFEYGEGDTSKVANNRIIRCPNVSCNDIIVLEGEQLSQLIPKEETLNA